MKRRRKTMCIKIAKEILDEGKIIAKANVEAEISISKVLQFPCEDEIRIIEIDATAPPSGEGIAPFYFKPSPQMNIAHPSGIALITPDEEGKLPLPEGWGSWSDAITIWPEVK